MLTLKVAAIWRDTSGSSGENELFCLSTTAGRPDEGPLGGRTIRFFDQNYIYLNTRQTVCRNLDLVGKQTQTGFTRLESDSTHRE